MTKKPPAAIRLPLLSRSGEREFPANSTARANRRANAFGVVELIVLMAVLALGVLLLAPSFRRAKNRVTPSVCANQLKSLGVAFRLYANDNDGRYPFLVLSLSSRLQTNDAAFDSFDPEDSADLWRVSQAAGNEIGAPRMLVCPEDARTFARDFNETNLTTESFAHPSNRLNALSYFFGLSVREDEPNHFVTGDRDLHRDGVLLGGGQRLGANLSETKSLEWGSEMHRRAGNIAFSDGRVQSLTTETLREALAKTGDTNNTVWLPNAEAKKSPGTL